MCKPIFFFFFCLLRRLRGVESRVGLEKKTVAPDLSRACPVLAALLTNQTRRAAFISREIKRPFPPLPSPNFGITARTFLEPSHITYTS
uniref:Putative secreted protein n=1 Tax=Ixodes ricinus TaxID=34613 RepID=A0A6B0U075_IXORI